MKKIIRTMQFKIIVLLLILLTSSVYSNDKQKDNTFIKDFDTILKFNYNNNIENKDERESLAKSFVTQGSVLQQQDNYAEAILEFQEALALDSTASICYAIAKSYNSLGFSVSALRYCQMSIRLDPFFTPPYDLLISIFYSFGLTENAFIVTKQLLNIDSSQANKYKYLNYAIEYETEKAQNLLENMIKDSTNTDAMWLLATIYQKLENNVQRNILISKIAELEPSNYSVVVELIEYYTEKNELSKLFPLLDKADRTMGNDQINNLYVNVGRGIMKYEKGLEDTLFIRDFIKRFDDRFYFDYFSQTLAGNLASYIGDTINTVKFLNRAFFLNKDDILPYQIAVVSYMNLKLDDSLKSVANTALERFPDSPEIHQVILNQYYYSKEYDKAIVYCKKLYDLDTNNLYYIITLADLYQLTENYKESDKYYELSLEIDPMNVLISNNYAYSLSTRNEDLSKALRLSQYAVEMEPDNSAYLDTFGWIQYQMGNYDEALKYILKSTEIESQSSLVFEHLGDIYIKLKEKDMALDAYKKSLNLDEKSEKVLLKINELEK